MAWSTKGITPQDQQRQQERMETRFSGSGARYLLDTLASFVPRDGQNKIRIVQPEEVDDLGWYSIEVTFHRGVGLDKSFYLCNQEMKIGPCYHTELQTDELWKRDSEQAKAYYPETRILMLVLDLLSDEPDKVRKWSCAIGLADEIVSQCHEPDTDTYKDPSDPVSGFAVFFSRAGQGKRTKYSGVKVGTQVLPLTDDHANQRVPFTEIIVVPEYDVVKSAFLNEMPPGEEGDGPPVDSYEEDINAEKDGGKYSEQGADAGTPEPEQEVEQEIEETAEAAPDLNQLAADYLGAMDRDSLKRFKVKHKGTIEALTFNIFTTTPDAEIATKILTGILDAGYMIDETGEVVKAEAATEVEPELEEEATPADTGAAAADEGSTPSVAGSQDKEKTDVKAALAAAISNRGK